MAEQLLKDIDRFKKDGPYTFREVFDFAKRTPQFENFDVVLNAALDDVSHKFAPEEFKLIIDTLLTLSTEDRKIWVQGTWNWTFPWYHECTNEQLLVLSEAPNAIPDLLHRGVNWWWIPTQTIYEILKLLQDVNLQRLRN